MIQQNGSFSIYGIVTVPVGVVAFSTYPKIVTVGSWSDKKEEENQDQVSAE